MYTAGDCGPSKDRHPHAWHQVPGLAAAVSSPFICTPQASAARQAANLALRVPVPKRVPTLDHSGPAPGYVDLYPAGVCGPPVVVTLIYTPQATADHRMMAPPRDRHQMLDQLWPV